jgi:hypothetical protein
MRVYVESVFDCPPELVWDEVQTSALLVEVIWPLVRLVPADPPQFPKRWNGSQAVRLRTYLFGFIPLGTHTIGFDRIDSDCREIETREHDPLIRRWDHTVRVQPTGDGRTLYSDDIEIEAGILTLPVVLFAHWFYRHRQRRWRAVAHRLSSARGA